MNFSTRAFQRCDGADGNELEAPPPGRIGVASQSGNLVSSYMNYAVATGVGISKAVSLGNSAQTGLPDLLEYFAVDPDTDVAVSYVEGVGDGRAFFRAARRLTERKPLVLVKGGARAEGQKAAADVQVAAP